MKFFKKYFVSEITNYLMIIAGSIITSLAYVWFLAPNKVTAGGLGGIAIIIYHLFNIPMGWTIFILNIPLFFIGIKFLGKMYGIRTILGITTVSFFVDLLDGKYFSFIKLQSFNVDIIIASLFGGLLVGIGVGLHFRAKGSGGGTDILAQVLSKVTSFTPGMVFIVVDFFIITISGILLGDNYSDKSNIGANHFELIFYGLIILFISSRVIDLVLDGLSISKNILIISDKSDEIREFIHHKLKRGATVFDAYGSYTNKERVVIMCVVSRKEVTMLREYIAKVDKDSFLIVSDTHQVLGDGFSRFNQFI